jgi:hypothetical protein
MMFVKLRDSNKKVIILRPLFSPSVWSLTITNLFCIGKISGKSRGEQLQGISLMLGTHFLPKIDNCILKNTGNFV